MGLNLILEVAITMAFIYLLLSVLVSGISEIFQLGTRSRGNFLYQSLNEVFNDRLNKDYTHLLFMHPLIDSLKESKGSILGASTKNRFKVKYYPSYIDQTIFATALIDTIALEGKKTTLSFNHESKKYEIVGNNDLNMDKLDAFREGVKHLKNSNLKILLETFIPDTKDGTELLRKVENWFNSYMSSVSTWYKRHMTKRLIIIGTLVAVSMNVDSIYVMKSMVQDKALREATVRAAEKYVEQNQEVGNSTEVRSLTVTMDSIKKTYQQLHMLDLPIGWGGNSNVFYPDNWWYRTFFTLFGWIITAMAISFGANFWFSLLTKIINLRSQVKPKSN